MLSVESDRSVGRFRFVDGPVNVKRSYGHMFNWTPSRPMYGELCSPYAKIIG